MSSNEDNRRAQTTHEPKTWASPVQDKDGTEHFVFEQSDLHPERKRRLGNYLSDTTKAQSKNVDVSSVPHKNSYTIDAGAVANTDNYTDDPNADDSFREAFNLFNSLSFGASSGDKPDIQPTKGEHKPVSHHSAQSAMSGRVQSRWSSIEGGFNIGVANIASSADSDASTPQQEEVSWQNYFKEKKEYSSEMRNKYKIDQAGVDLLGYNIEKDKALKKIEPEETLPSDYTFVNNTEHSYTGLTYGMRHDENNRFVNSSLDPRSTSLSFALDLVEIWAQGVLQANLGNLFQVLSYALSEADAKGAKFGILGKLKNSVESGWENIYTTDPRFQDPTKLFKGSSGWNQDVYRKNYEDLETSFSMVIGNGTEANVKNVLKATAKDELLKVANVTSYYLRKLDIHIPKHTLTNMRGLVGANEATWIEGGKILLAYNLASVAGIVHLAAHALIHGFLDYRDKGFFKNLSMNLRKSRSFWKSFIEPGDHQKFGGERMDHFLGMNNKIVRFYNYTVLLGDIVTLSEPNSHAWVSENKIPLDSMKDHNALRLAKYRRNGSRESTFSMGSLPSLYLVPKNNNLWGGMIAAADNDDFAPMGPVNVHDGKTKHDHFKSPDEGHRFTKKQVQQIEDDLEAEMMPFYIQDLRTNEIISFHAFLTDLSDSYTADWSAQKGFGRMEAAQIYGGGSRSVGVSFSMVSFNEQDFDEMWYKINKLTTLVYPQWSRGTKFDYGPDSANQQIVQPFSQVPTASPLCRIRVGDILTSNYSKQNVARLFGVGSDTSLKYETLSETLTILRLLNESGRQRFRSLAADQNIMISTADLARGVEHDDGSKTLTITGTKYVIYNVSEKEYLSLTYQPITSNNTGGGVDIAEFFNSDNNPIIRAFESTAGRGIAVAINSIGFSWKYGEYPWNSEPGSRAPRICDISLGLIPIHDITPGLDHNGFNRAPIYGVGNIMNNLKGDPHLGTKEYNDMLSKINADIDATLRPRKP